MKREGKDKSWDFLLDCNENQWQLINDIMGSLHATGSIYGMRRNKKYCCITRKGYYITYYDFIRGIVNAIGEKPKVVMQSKDNDEAEENILMLSCLKSLAWKQPQYFKTLYNLASTSTEDVVEELEIRFSTSPALRHSLPAVLCTLLAQTFSVELSDKGKQAIDENLTTLEKNSQLGNYRYAGSLAKVLSLSNPGLWALGGPVGIVLGMAYNIGKEMLSQKKDSAKQKESVGQKDKDAREKATVLACALIMLRRDVCGIDWNEKQAYANVCKWMDDCSFSLSAEEHSQEEKAFVETLFLKILKAKDEEKYRLVMNSYGYTEERHTRIDEKINAKIKLLLPHAAYLVEKLWDKLIADHSKEYYYTMPQLSARMTGKTCLVIEFHPDFIDNENRVHFLVDNASRGSVMLCLELMGHDSTAVCKELASLNKEYDRIFVSNETQREEMYSYLNPRSYHGRVYSLYADFVGNTATSNAESEIKDLKEELNKKKEELQKCQMQIDGYEKKVRLLENSTRSFRHTRMPNIMCRFSDIIFDIQRIKNEMPESTNEEFDSVLHEMANIRDMLDKFTRQIAKQDDICKVSLFSVTKEVFDDIRTDIKVEYVNNNVDSHVLISKAVFQEWVLENIKSNIERHAFPKTDSIDNPRVRIGIAECNDSIILTIENNGKKFTGDPSSVFRKAVKFGETGHTGEGLYLAKCYIDDYHPNGGEIILTPNPNDDFSVAMEIKIKK